MAEYLLPSGYKFLTVDIQWYEPESKGLYYNPNATLTMDPTIAAARILSCGLKKYETTTREDSYGIGGMV